MVAALLELCFGAAVGDDDGTSGGRPRRGVPAPAELAESSDTLTEQDRALVERIHRGDATAFDTIVDLYYDRVARFSYGLLGEQEAAQDIAQDLFGRIWTLGLAWSPKGSIRAYLFRAARNRALNVIARQQTQARAQRTLRNDDFIVPDDRDLVLAEQITALRIATAKLPERRRTVLRLRYEEGMTCAAIGAVLAMSTKSAEQLIALSIQTLRKALRTFG